MLGPKNFWVQKCFRVKSFLGPSKNLLVQNILGKKTLNQKNIFGQKWFGVHQNFVSKKILCQTKFCVHKNFVSRQILEQKDWVKKFPTWPVLTKLDLSWLDLICPNLTWPVSIWPDLSRLNLSLIALSWHYLSLLDQS